MRKPILAGNWKMNKISGEAASFFAEFGAARMDHWAQAEIMFGVSYTLLAHAKGLVKDTPLKILAQNVHFEASGAYTGEVSVGQLRDLGVDGAIVGHSERRQYYVEDDAGVGKKVKCLQEQGMLAVACVGETKEQREDNLTETVIKTQMAAILAAATSVENLVIAYEPVWAIGTGLTASDEQAQQVHRFIRGLVSERFGSGADEIRILYGGSAKPGNIRGLMSQVDIDGGLVGGASLKADDFAAMANLLTS